MQFNTIVALALVGVNTATAAPHPSEDISVSPRMNNDLFARDSFECRGSSMCGGLQVRACDDAVNNKLIRNNDVNYGAQGSGRPHSGACSNIFGGFGCGVFIKGDRNCARSGNDIWNDYQEIRRSGCNKCGSKHWGNGCLTTIDYVSGC